ncbi:pentatricopeptide repeat-containing family protein [Dorcoceras hygrometricum]|uniref:Pentatricopeptide repeat-containing family protein n=1 Tax=Dorcoceras hygrometricum TaxID=472368 RepID=A0A2Z7AL48_9LAMI|nr:pentatricopeptide repeat-containing family protein [Dorcoceras hygrometricum]
MSKCKLIDLAGASNFSVLCSEFLSREDEQLHPLFSIDSSEISLFVDSPQIFITPIVAISSSSLSFFFHIGCLSDAMYNVLISNGITPDIFVLNNLLSALVMASMNDSAREMFIDLGGDLESGLELFDKIVADELTLDKVIYKVQEISETGTVPDAITYTTLIDGFCKNKNVNSAMKKLNEMHAKALYQAMLAKNIVPDIVIFSVLVQGLCNKGQVGNAAKMLKDMKKKNVTPNVLIYNKLIAGYFRDANLIEAFRLHDEMLDRGLTPDDATYDLLVSGKLNQKLSLSSFLVHEPSSWNYRYHSLLLEGEISFVNAV